MTMNKKQQCPNTFQLPLRADMVNYINNKVHHTDCIYYERVSHI